ncbi:holocytochrome c synthase [Saccharomycopsis crataegensis]|uniref:Holocytochrome c-type synthase n=1 Tax=Saccharomycopsis crataegensis TaxID=43959 RepID=A0AAV5QD85_9ASCO|nr:holocytochrome c synthase [Saccharomycopsis crataegensis]
MGWFWADSEASNSTTSGCPVNHKALASSGGSCPVKHTKKKDTQDPVPAVCPVDHKGINPLNNMPKFISSAKLPGQKLDLPTERTISTIPRGADDGEGFWEYPSPQQMLNAMVRKGKDEGVEEDAVESMVDVHNFLNEGAWQEILEWEKPYTHKAKIQPRLAKFTGRPDEMSPRATMYMYLSKVLPTYFGDNPPFDRHDWTVLRSEGIDSETGSNKWKEVRYVIDYYGGADSEEGHPTFFLDVRPALDNPQNACDRWKKWSGPWISKALGRDGEK